MSKGMRRIFEMFELEDNGLTILSTLRDETQVLNDHKTVLTVP